MSAVLLSLPLNIVWLLCILSTTVTLDMWTFYVDIMWSKTNTDVWTFYIDILWSFHVQYWVLLLNSQWKPLNHREQCSYPFSGRCIFYTFYFLTAFSSKKPPSYFAHMLFCLVFHRWHTNYRSKVSKEAVIAPLGELILLLPSSSTRLSYRYPLHKWPRLWLLNSLKYINNLPSGDLQSLS